MYSVFELPDDFLSHEYTEPEKSFYDKKLTEAIYGPEALTEELTADQKSRVDSWGNVDPVVKAKHDNVFGDSDRIVIPYDSSNETPVTSTNYRTVPEINNVAQVHHHAVLNALHRHGYRTDDYVSGRVYHMDTPEKKIKIMQALQETGEADKMTDFKSKPKYAVDEKGAYKLDKKGNKIIAVPPRPLTMAQVYAADPVRAASTKPKQIVITRNRYDVAGMSTGRGWRSCMHMEDGINRHYLPADMQQGTLTAYVATVAEPKAGEAPKDVLESPIGRINLKRFDSSRGDTIFRPEASSYGTIPTNFKKNVREWAEKNYPISAGIYTKDASLYNDDGNNVIIEQPEKLHAKEASDFAIKSADDIMYKAYDDAENANPDKDGVYPNDHYLWGRRKALDTVTKAHENLDDKEFANAVINGIAKHSENYYGKEQNRDSRFDEKQHYSGWDDINGNDVYDKWALENGFSTRKLKAGISQMSSTEMLNHLGNIHSSMKDNEENGHEALKDVHSMLLNHMIDSKGHTKKQYEEPMNLAIHHMLDKKNDPYYGDSDDVKNPFEEIKSNIFRLSKNPRTLHRMLTSLYVPDSSPKDLRHIGEHADARLAHHYFLDAAVEIPSADEHFMHGLNKNINGEKIQHALVDDIHQQYNSDNIVRIHPNSHEDETNINALSNIAQHTKFPSVYDSIKERFNHPKVQFALSANNNMNQPRLFESFIKYRQSKGR